MRERSPRKSRKTSISSKGHVGHVNLDTETDDITGIGSRRQKKLDRMNSFEKLIHACKEIINDFEKERKPSNFLKIEKLLKDNPSLAREI